MNLPRFKRENIIVLGPGYPDNIQVQNLDDEQESDVWWFVAFTCIFQTLHSKPIRSVEFLLKFLAGLLTFLGRYSIKIADKRRFSKFQSENNKDALHNG